MLDKIRDAKRGQDHYYISFEAGVGNPVFQNELPYDTGKFPDAGYRLLSLYRYWNIIQYYFPYKHLIEEDWKDVLAEFLQEFAGAKNDLEYKLAALQLISRVHDTHANIWGRDTTLRNYMGVRNVPVSLKFIDEKPVVTGIAEVTGEGFEALQVGDIIVQVNSQPVTEIVKERLKYTAASNYPTQLRIISNSLLRTNDTILPVVFERNGRQERIMVHTYEAAKIHFGNPMQRPDSLFKMIRPDIAYVYPGSIKEEYLANIRRAGMNAKGMIIDLRCYPSEFIVFSLGNYLVKDPTPFVKFTNASPEMPGTFTYTEPLEVGIEGNLDFNGKVVILVNEMTQSQAEYTAMAFRAARGATVIGSTTAGADGNVSWFNLPGGISTMISGIGVYYPDGKETQRIGIIPDIEVKPTVEGIRQGRDEVLERALEIIEKG